MNTAAKSPLEMSDDEIMAMSSPPVAEASTAVTDDAGTPATEVVEESAVVADNDDDSTEESSAPASAPSTADDAGTAAPDGGSTDAASAGPDGAAAGGDGTGEGQGDGSVAPGAAAATTSSAEGNPPAAAAKPLTDADYVAAGKELFAPFKANGKDFQVQSVDEARKLMQMGCNYTKKMQELQPVKRIITMLSNNQLLDEGKLAYLIDLDKKNPQAIQKLLADSQFDPMAADKDTAASYTPGQHQVSDLEIQFNDVLEEVATSPTGNELISEVHGQWDPASKQALFQNPEILRQINEHKAMGLYAVIHAELDRQKTLGQVPAGTPFLQAYKAIGDMLHAQGRLIPPQARQAQVPAAVAPAAPVETRVVAPPAQVAANDKAKAAAPTKSSTPAAAGKIAYLDLPDDEFMKQTGARL